MKKIISLIFIITLAIILIPVLLVNFLLTTTKPSQSQNKPAFITTNGPHLTYNSHPFHAIGVNYYDLQFKNNDLIARTFSHLQGAGITTLRFWLFSDADPNGLQKAPGQYNEQRFRQVDYILDQANKNNIKLIPTLINNWPDYGGKNQYLRWTGKNPETDENDFYTDPQIKSLFQDYIKYVLSRKNTYTNIKYSDDPAILAWDIMNEPRGEEQTAMNNWLESIAIFIKQHDQNHLILAGTETAFAPIITEGKSSSLCEKPAIDICSTHLYLYHQNYQLYKNYNEVTTFIQQQKNYADKLNKPLILEEYGIPRDKKPFEKEPLSMLNQITDEVRKNNYAGYLIWDWADTRTSNFTFTPNNNTQGAYSLDDLKQILQ